jgi:hypothetical protein
VPDPSRYSLYVPAVVGVQLSFTFIVVHIKEEYKDKSLCALISEEITTKNNKSNDALITTYKLICARQKDHSFFSSTTGFVLDALNVCKLIVTIAIITTVAPAAMNIPAPRGILCAKWLSHPYAYPLYSFESFA